MSKYSKEVVKELAEDIKRKGFRVFIAERGTYGFYTDKGGHRVVSFQVDYLSPCFSGNYMSKKSGTGWRMDDTSSPDYAAMLSAFAPSWAVSQGDSIRHTTLEDHLARYNKSSHYKEV